MAQLCPPPVLIREKVLSLILSLRFWPHEDDLDGGGFVVLITITLTTVIVITRADRKSQVRQCLGFYTADSWTKKDQKSAVLKPKYCPAWDFLPALVSVFTAAGERGRKEHRQRRLVGENSPLTVDATLQKEGHFIRGRNPVGKSLGLLVPSPLSPLLLLPLLHFANVLSHLIPFQSRTHSRPQHSSVTVQGGPCVRGLDFVWHKITNSTTVQGEAGGRTHGLVDFDIDVPPFCPAIQPIQPYSHLPKQS